MKYTRETLAAAVAGATSMAAVLRHLGIPPNGGAHAHLRRRIDHFGIDRSHFLGQAHRRGKPSPLRRTPDEILVLRPPTARRAASTSLTRALLAVGRPHHCALCGTGDRWAGRRLTLHVDHVDGRFWDCRAGNLRFLCPNCHSQTSTYAGRNRRHERIPLIRVDAHGDPVADQVPRQRPPAEEVLDRLDRAEVTVAEAARLLGCHRNHIYRLRERRRECGSLAPATRARGRRVVDPSTVIAFAVANPLLGPRRLATALARRANDPVVVSHGTVSNILTAAGLNTHAARIAAASEGSAR
ncbi:hypothetical protein [Krasilnikovia sp. MM14-A1004]|uniref:hypothetical protein n=1 Tax=Krasilnikovia sp. MM14-A1004 TaxID=3373541 RepID=UPI00399CA00B